MCEAKTRKKRGQQSQQDREVDVEDAGQHGGVSEVKLQNLKLEELWSWVGTSTRLSLANTLIP